MTEADIQPPVVPGSIGVVRDFVNTTDHETATDELSTPAQLTRFLHDAGLLQRRTPSTPDDLALARELRAGLRKALELNHDNDSSAIPELEATLRRLPLELRWAGNSAELAPIASGVEGALARIALAMNQAIAEGIWWRLKVCSSDECEWAYYDKSKNRSARWCEYGCGDKLKMRAYRARQKAGLAAN